MLKKKYIYIYIQKSTRKSWKSGERNSAETAPRTGDKRSRIGNTNTPGGVYNMVVSSNARFIRDAHARTPNSALIVNTWKVWFGHGDHVLQACISSQGKTRRNGGSVVVGREKRGWRERERWYECIANIARYLFCLDGGAVFWFERISIELVSLRVGPRVVCVRAHVCTSSHEDSRWPPIHRTRRQKLGSNRGDWKVFLTLFDA